MVGTVVLDLWNTLLANPQIHPIEKILKLTKIPLQHHELVQRCDEIGLFTRTVDSLILWQEILKQYGKEEFASKANEIWLNTSKETAFFPKTGDFLHTLKSKYKLGLATEINKTSFEVLDEHFNLSHHFDFVSPTYKVGVHKNTQFYRFLCQKFDCEPSDMVMIGDNVYKDIIPASQAGMKTILLNRFKLSQEELQDVPNGTPICHSYEQVLSLLQLRGVAL